MNSMGLEIHREINQTKIIVKNNSFQTLLDQVETSKYNTNTLNEFKGINHFVTFKDLETHFFA